MLYGVQQSGGSLERLLGVGMLCGVEQLPWEASADSGSSCARVDPSTQEKVTSGLRGMVDKSDSS